MREGENKVSYVIDRAYESWIRAQFRLLAYLLATIRKMYLLQVQSTGKRI